MYRDVTIVQKLVVDVDGGWR